MIILPAIDIYGGKAVRLFKGDYSQMTVYSDDPAAFALEFYEKGAVQLHVVDLEGAKTGQTPNFEAVKSIVSKTPMLVETGGGIRSDETVDRYIDAGVGRVIIGTAAVTDRPFLERCVAKYGKKIAVGADIKDGFVAVKGWTEKSALTCDGFFEILTDCGVSTVICTDISKDGALSGTNTELYRHLVSRFGIDIIASGGVTSADDIAELKKIGVYGAILGKALYEKKIELTEALEAAR